MFRAARGSSILMFWLMAGGMLLAGDEPPLGVLLILVGMTMPLVTANRAMDNARKRQSKVRDFTTTWKDVANLSSRDVVMHVASLLIGICMIIAPQSHSWTRALNPPELPCVRSWPRATFGQDARQPRAANFRFRPVAGSQRDLDPRARSDIDELQADIEYCS